MNGEVAAYGDLVESLARKFVGRNGAEFDDLVQEGLISAWQALCRGVTPSPLVIEYRMRDWTTWLGRQSPVEYGQMLPLDDFRGLQ